MVEMLEYETEAECNLIWNCIPLATIWTIWNTRNAYVFDNANPDWVEILELIKTRVAPWVKTRGENEQYTVNEIQDKTG